MRQPDTTIRVFIALDIGPEARRVLKATVQRLQVAIPRGVRWVDPAGIHLTLKFLGNIDPNLVDSVFEAMRQGAQGTVFFQLRLHDLGLFPNARQPRVLWVGVDGDLGPLKELQNSVDESVSALGFSRDKQPFYPHLTLGRVQDGVTSTIRSQIGAVVSLTPLNPPLLRGETGGSPLLRGETEGSPLLRGETKGSPLLRGETEGSTVVMVDTAGSAPVNGGLQECPLWTVHDVRLIRSTLTPRGAVYTSLGSVPLWK